MIDMLTNSFIMDMNEDISPWNAQNEPVQALEQNSERICVTQETHEKKKIQFLYRNRKMLVNVDNILSFVSNSSNTHNIRCFVSCLTMRLNRTNVVFVSSLFRSGFNVCIYFLCDTKQIRGRD